MERYEEILEFWFEGISADTNLSGAQDAVRKWFGKSDEIDQYIITHFSSDLNKARKGRYEAWTGNARSLLALIIILDQFSRVIYRSSGKAFDTDLQSLEYALKAIKEGFDQEFILAERIFCYMPFMHSENFAVQKKGLEFFNELVEEAKSSDEKNVPYLEGTLRYAEKHRDIIVAYERFPHRNKILNRRSTSKEVDFLEQSGSSF